MGVLQDEGVIAWVYTYLHTGLWSQEELLTRRSIRRPSAHKMELRLTLSSYFIHLASFRMASLELIIIRLSRSFFGIFAGLG